MKTLFIITGIVATFLLTKNNKLQVEKRSRTNNSNITVVELDSVLEAGRIEKMKGKFI